MKVDVAIVGAGPAGTAAAISLARAGARVSLSDRARFPRAKSCGDGLTTGALRRLELLGLDVAAVASFCVVAELTVRSPSGRVVALPFRDDGGIFAAVARRTDLDAALVEVARRSGANVFEESRCTSIEERGDGLELGFADGRSILAGRLVAADGAWSESRKLVEGRQARRHGDGRRGQWLAQRAYLSPARPVDRARMWVWFSPELLPGYAWSFPLADGSANVGVGVATASGRSLAEAWKSTMRGPFIESLFGRGAALEEPARAWPIPTGLSAGSLVGLEGKVLFAGDAAGAADPFTGEGIGQALECGMLAAAALTESLGDAGRRYSERVLSGLGKDHAIAGLCQRLFARRSGARAALGIVDRGAFTRRNLARWLFEDYPRSVITAPRSWGEAKRLLPAPFAGVRSTP